MSNNRYSRQSANNHLYDQQNTVQRPQRSTTILNFDQEDDVYDRGMRESLLKESNHLSRSEQLVDEQFDIALKTHESLVNQRSTINSMREGFNNVTNRFTSVNSLIKNIRIRRRRDTIIVAFVFAMCLGLFLYHLFF